MTSPAPRPRSAPASTDRPRRESARGREHVRRSIISASLELFASEGFEQTTVRKIARRCGVTDALLYYYFPSKRDILAAIWDIPQARVLHRVEPGVPLTIERLLALVDEMISASVEMDAMIRLMIRRALAGDTAASAFRERTMGAWRRDVDAHFRTVLPQEDAELNTDILTSVVFGATFPAQASAGAGYTELASSAEFHQAIHEIVLVALPFCRDRAEQ